MDNLVAHRRDVSGPAVQSPITAVICGIPILLMIAWL